MKAFNKNNSIVIENTAYNTFKEAREEIYKVVPEEERQALNEAMYSQVNGFLDNIISDNYEDPLSEKEFHFEIKKDSETGTTAFKNRYITKICEFQTDCRDIIKRAIEGSIRGIFEEVGRENYGKKEKSTNIK